MVEKWNKYTIEKMERLLGVRVPVETTPEKPEIKPIQHHRDSQTIDILQKNDSNRIGSLIDKK